MKMKSMTVALVTAGVVATVSAANLAWSPSQWFHGKPAVSQNSSAPAVAPAIAAAASAPIGPISAPNYRGIVERYGSAVVGVNTEGTTKTDVQSLPEGMRDDPFFKFFRGLPGYGEQGPNSGVPTRGMGSGFIVGQNGLILTNAHVVRDADEVTVKLIDRREYKAKVLGSDPATDVAVLKINANNLPVVSLGDPAQLGVGDYVLAIGSPFGFEQSATAGIVSAKGRSLPGDGNVPFIQTDVAVNPGNSGGPLFDANGRVVGINSQIYSRTGGYQGVSFAIPIDVALRVKDEIVKTGKVVHARLGVTVQQLSQNLAESFKLKQPDGALVSSVTPGSAAAKAGLQPGDVILKFNNKPILASNDLPALVSMEDPGDKVTLDVWRGGKHIALNATLSEAKDSVAANDATTSDAHGGKLGVAVRALTPEEKSEANLASGVLVEQVTGRAERAGIEPGDVILAVNGTSVKTVNQLQSLVSKEGKQLALLIQRGQDKIFIPVGLG